VIVRLTQWQPRSGLSRDEAQDAWRRHAELVESLPGLRRYVQKHAVLAPDGSEPPYAGLGEAWFDSEASARAALASEEWKAVLEDASRFMDLETVVAAWAEQRLELTPSRPVGAP
jgi:uncharacterized protein (TIGR02118 family)